MDELHSLIQDLHHYARAIELGAQRLSKVEVEKLSDVSRLHLGVAKSSLRQGVGNLDIVLKTAGVPREEQAADAAQPPRRD